MKRKILIADLMHEGIVEALEGLGFEVEYLPDIDRVGILEKIPDCTGIIIRSKTDLNAEILQNSRIKFIARAGAGVDKIDEAFCRDHRISIINAPEGNRDALGEHVIGMLLTLLNKIHTADREVRDGVWDREGNRGVEIQGKTIGIIGYGNMGSAFARRLSGFDCRVLAYDKYKEGYDDGYAFECSMEELFIQTDIVSFHVPLTTETDRYYNRDFFTRFRKDLYIVNAARGAILPLSDLIGLLDEGKILGAALDVLENEHLKNYSEEEKKIFKNLTGRKNIVLTPHVGGWSHDSYRKINDVLVNKIKNLGLIV